MSHPSGTMCPEMTESRQLRAIREQALVQHHVMTRRQLVDLGVASTTITERVQRGEWETLAPGVYDVVCGKPPPHRDLMAAVARAGGVAYARSAAALWDLVPAPPVPEVAVARSKRPRTVRARVHRPRLVAEDLARRQGIPTVTVERAVIALADEDVLDAALRLGLTTTGRVAARCDALAGARGVGKVAAMLEARAGETGRTESFAEDRLARILRSIPGVDWIRQHVVADEGGVVARLDFVCVPARLAVEVDGYGPHSGRRSFQADRTRRIRLAAMGWTNLVFTYGDVTRRQRWVREQILLTLRGVLN